MHICNVVKSGQMTEHILIEHALYMWFQSDQVHVCKRSKVYLFPFKILFVHDIGQNIY